MSAPIITASDIRWTLNSSLARQDAPALPPAEDAMADLALGEATAIDMVVTATLEAHSYRLVAQSAVHYAHDLYADNERLRRQLAQLREEHRALRATQGVAA